MTVAPPTESLQEFASATMAFADNAQIVAIECALLATVFAAVCIGVHAWQVGSVFWRERYC